MKSNGIMPGRYPAVVKSYDQATRLCRVEIPGITDGGDVYPLAEIQYPIGDKSKAGVYATEIEILAGDTVWVDFIGGDSRYPIITGYRNPQSGNSIDDYRRLHHANIEMTADGTMKLNAETLEINVTTITVTSTDTNIASKVNITGSELKHNTKNVGSTHTHSGVQSGGSDTGAPN